MPGLKVGNREELCEDLTVYIMSRTLSRTIFLFNDWFTLFFVIAWSQDTHLVVILMLSIISTFG